VKMAIISDSSDMLKQEIEESVLRLKAAKHGVKLSSIVPHHEP